MQLGTEENSALWLMDTERRAILPIKWVLLTLCIALVLVNSPGGLPHRSLFYCLLFFLIENLVFSYLVYGKRIAPLQVQVVSFISYACDVAATGLFVYLMGRLIEVPRAISGDFYILFFLVILRGALSFQQTRMNLSVNMGIGLAFVLIFGIAHYPRFMSRTEFLSRVVILGGVMVLSWFLMEILASQRRRVLRANEKLRLDHQYAERLFESITDGVIAISPELQITAINDAARDILGIEGTGGPGSYPVGGDILLLPREIAEAVTLTLEEALRYTNQVIEATRRDGNRITIRFSTRTIRSSEGTLEGIVAIFEDISVLRRLEDQMIRSEKLASVGELAAGIAHELGNPLGIIRSCAAYLKSRWENPTHVPPEVREKAGLDEELEVLLSESQRCQQLVRRLLSFSSRSEPRIVSMPLGEAIERAVSLVRYQKEADGIEFETAPGENVERVRADPNLLEQALVNILLNAVQAMNGTGRILIRFRQEEPVASGLPREDHEPRVCIDISDTGCGIPQKDLDHVFDPFFTTKETGTGLGLSITHGIMERMEGTISLHSEPGKGTTVTLVLPAVGGGCDPA